MKEREGKKEGGTEEDLGSIFIVFQKNFMA